MSRNKFVEIAVDGALSRIDAFIGGEVLASLPSGETRTVLDAQLMHGSNSVRLASLFFVFYALADKSWDCNSIPTGLRGKWGDKRLASELGLRDITLHNAVTAFGENMGWKGNVEAFRLSTDKRFAPFVAELKKLDESGRLAAANYMAARFAESRRVIPPLPPVGDDVLTYARARELFYTLVGTPSEGNIQQFLVASLLSSHRSRYGYVIKTHHVHASDKFDTTAGDIEEFRDLELVRAYEVTVRPDWKNRVGDFRAKMDEFGLKKYTIIASDVNSDHDLSEPAAMLRFLEPYGRDLAVIDIYDFVNVFASELSARELRLSINSTYEYLKEPKLCGRSDIIEDFLRVVGNWLNNSAHT